MVQQANSSTCGVGIPDGHWSCPGYSISDPALCWLKSLGPSTTHMAGLKESSWFPVLDKFNSGYFGLLGSKAANGRPFAV